MKTENILKILEKLIYSLFLLMNTLKSEHLNPWEKPIYICFDHIKNSLKEEILYWLWFNRWVDYYSWVFRNKIMGNINPAEDSYVISPVNRRNKISRKYYNCTWVAIVWKDLNWKNISFLTHQDPHFLFKWHNNYDKEIMFKNELQNRIDEFKTKAIKWTIDICIVWWNYLSIYENEHKTDYVKSINLLKEIIYKNFWFYPLVVWPILDSWFSDIVLDTKNRRVIQRRWRKEDFMLLDNTLFQADKLEEIIPELDEKCKL